MIVILIIVAVVCVIVVIASWERSHNAINQTNKIISAIKEEKEKQRSENIDNIEKKTNEFNNHYAEVFSHQAEGLRLEIAKDIENAIKEYEIALKIDNEYFGIEGYGKETAKHLCAIYHRLERYDDELRAIHRVLDYGYDANYVHRITEVMDLKLTKENS